jgi:hypothetical protein
MSPPGPETQCAGGALGKDQDCCFDAVNKEGKDPSSLIYMLMLFIEHKEDLVSIKPPL